MVRHSLQAAPGTAGNFITPSGKLGGWPPLSGGLKARDVYQLPFRNMTAPGLVWKYVCASPSLSVVNVVGSNPASTQPRTTRSVSTTRGSLHESLPLRRLS